MQKIFIAKFRLTVKHYNIIAFTVLLSTVHVYYWQCHVLNRFKCNTRIACRKSFDPPKWFSLPCM